MSRDIGPGDVVEVARVMICSCGCAPPPALGRRFIVHEVCHHIKLMPGVVLADLPTPAPHHCWPLSMFRPIGGSREEVLRQFKQPTEAERENA